MYIKGLCKGLARFFNLDFRYSLLRAPSKSQVVGALQEAGSTKISKTHLIESMFTYVYLYRER